MKLSNQALMSIMMVLQKGLMEQSDVTQLLEQLDFIEQGDPLDPDHKELFVSNPPVLRFTNNEE